MNTALQGLYAITPQRAERQQLLEQAAAALSGGARLLQYRDKHSAPDERLWRARALRRLCRQHHARFIVNDDVELALKSAADGVHLGKHDAAITHARQRLGRTAIIGISCYNELPRAVQAQQQQADYVAFGAVFPSRTKPQAVQAPLNLIRQARQQLSLPIVAIGGINPDNAALVIEAGAHMLAMIEALFSSPDIQQQARHISQLFSEDYS